jgi:predicted acetyltransferase
MSIEIRQMREGDRDAFVSLRSRTFQLSAAAMAASWAIPACEVLVAVDAGVLVGSIRSESVGQFFGRRSVPCGVVTAVAVEPACRSAGVGRALISAALTQMAERGLAMTTLHASIPNPYRRAGYEVGGMRSRWTIPVERLDGLSARYRIVRATAKDLKLLRLPYREFAAEHTGLIDRTDTWWDTRVLPHAAADDGECFLAVDDSEAVAGYVLFTRIPQAAGSGRSEPDFTFDLMCHDLVWRDGEAARSLLGLLHGYRAIAHTVLFPGAPLDPLTTVLSGQPPTMDPSFLYLSRILDVERAVRARGWAGCPDVDVRVRITDPILRRDDDCYRIRIEDGEGMAERVDSADITIDVGAFSALYCGAMSFADAQSLGRARCRREAEGSALGHVFPRGIPWVMDVF